jgi:hypothetical protein
MSSPTASSATASSARVHMHDNSAIQAMRTRRIVCLSQSVREGALCRHSQLRWARRELASEDLAIGGWLIGLHQTRIMNRWYAECGVSDDDTQTTDWWLQARSCMCVRCMPGPVRPPVLAGARLLAHTFPTFSACAASNGVLPRPIDQSWRSPCRLSVRPAGDVAPLHDASLRNQPPVARPCGYAAPA